VRGQAWWSRLGSNQRPSACEADALPLSHGTSTRSGLLVAPRRKTSTVGICAEHRCSPDRFVGFAPRVLLSPSQRGTNFPGACGCSAVGSASPCQGEGRGFESRHPLEGANWASNPTVEWPSGEATACKAVHTGSIPVSTSEVHPARLAQRESASLTRKRSLVQSQYRAPRSIQVKPIFQRTTAPRGSGRDRLRFLHFHE
jgi:hypothetical protein